MSGPDALSLNEQAALGPVRAPERSQLAHLVRHFLERFFNHETASPDGDAKGRLVLIAVAAGLPPFMVAIYLWPVYHPFIGWPPGQPAAGPPPYWAQVNHHFFFVMYSFVAMGLVTVFEWDLFFPDLLDVFVLGTLPVAGRRIFLARLGAIAVFVFGFLFDANVLAPVVLPMATDPPNLLRFVAGDVVAVAAGGLFAAAFIVALQGVVLSALGERMFRRISLAVQGLAVTVLVMMMLLFPVLSGVTPGLLQSGNAIVRWFPPFWFLGMYQRILEGPAALPIFAELARIGGLATLAAGAVALGSYPLAYARRVRALVEGAASRSMRNRMAAPLNALLHATAVRPPVRRAVFHFIGQTLLRVPRYRIYLVLYGGVGLSVVAASVLRFSIQGQHLRVGVSADGIRVAIAVVAFWVIAGMRAAFVSSGNRQGSWALRIVHGQPPHFDAAIEELTAAKVWVALCAAERDIAGFRAASARSARRAAVCPRDSRTTAGCDGHVPAADGRVLPECDGGSFHRRHAGAIEPGVYGAEVFFYVSVDRPAVGGNAVFDRTKRTEFRDCNGADRGCPSLVAQAPSRRGAPALRTDGTRRRRRGVSVAAGAAVLKGRD